MKKYYKTLGIIFAFVFFGHCVSAQETADLLKDILARLKEIEKEESQKIGVISFNHAEKYSVYSQGEFVVAKVTVDSIVLTIVEGCVFDVVVYAGRRRFTNGAAPIALTPGRMIKKDHLVEINGDGTRTMIFQELITLPLEKGYIPDDNGGILKKGKNTLELKRNVSINTILDARVYTDGLGLIGGQPNGLAQTDLKFKHILHRGNVSNRGLSFVRHFKINMHVSKFDSKDKYTDSSGYSRSKLFQKSYAGAAAALNVFNGWLLEKKSPNSFYLDGGGGINISRMIRQRDSVSTELVVPYWFLEFGINLKVSDNIGADAQVRYTNQYLPANNFTNDKGLVEFYKFGAEIYYNPVEDRPSRVFARVNYNLSMIKADQKNGFFQFQVGYSVLLTKLIDKK